MPQPDKQQNESLPLRVFLCHGREDKPKVRELYNQLQTAGFDPWLDEEDLLPGQDWQLEITKAVRASDIVIICLSQTSITKSGFVQKEIKFALDVADEKPAGTIFLIPLRFENCDVPERLRNLHWVDFFAERGYERLLRALKARATALSKIDQGGAAPAIEHFGVSGRALAHQLELTQITDTTRTKLLKQDSSTPYGFPELSLLNASQPHSEQTDEALRHTATLIAGTFKKFKVTGRIEYICPGPVVTTYEFKPDPGVKYSRVTGLVDDLCLALKAESIRIDRVPGKAHVGIEVPNQRRDNIMLREVVESRHFQESPSRLTLALGKTIDGLNYVADLARMPHLLIAGATGTGKSVCLNSIVLSIIYKSRPDEVKFIMIDPKRLELGLYADIPHLATPIITEPKRAAYALKWAVAEMERRFLQLAQRGVKDIDSYNQEGARRKLGEDYDDEGQPHQPLPYLVIVVDELVDLMLVSGREVEEAITRLAQMASAVGLHLVLATQRPSGDVITGLIKANFPSRIAFRVSSKRDSRTIIDANGAEQLLGRGDMLFLPPRVSRLVRVHGAYIDDAEIDRVVAHVKAQGQPLYDETITQSEEEAENIRDQQKLFERALRICVEMRRASTSVLQRRLSIGYGRAAALLDDMERAGYIGQAGGARPRQVLSKAYETVANWESATK